MISNPTAGWEQSGKETWKGCLHCKSPAGLACLASVSRLSLAAVTSGTPATFPRLWPGWITRCWLLRAMDCSRTPEPQQQKQQKQQDQQQRQKQDRDLQQDRDLRQDRDLQQQQMSSTAGCGGRGAPALSGKAMSRPAGRSRPSHPDVSQPRRRSGQSDMTSRGQVQPGEQGQGKALRQSRVPPRTPSAAAPQEQDQHPPSRGQCHRFSAPGEGPGTAEKERTV